MKAQPRIRAGRIPQSQATDCSTTYLTNDSTMKTFALLVLVFTWCVSARSQGTVLFNNGPSSSVNAPVYESDGITKLSGPQFMAELFAGPNVNSLGSIAMTGFLTGNSAGYFYGGVQTINSVLPGGNAWFQVDVWNTASGATFGQAQASSLPDSWWQSSVFMEVTGNPFALPPTLPSPLFGLGTSPVFLNSVPEPSSLTFFWLGFAAMFVSIRRHRNLSQRVLQKQSSS